MDEMALDEETIRIIMETMPGEEDTLVFPKVSMEPLLPDSDVPLPEGAPPRPHVLPLPPNLMNDPILKMAAPHPTSAFDATFGDRPTHIPARPRKGPRIRLTWRDHVLAGLAAAVFLMAIASYAEVRSGWRAEMPQPAQTQQDQVQDTTVADDPRPQDPANSPEPVIAPTQPRKRRSQARTSPAPQSPTTPVQAPEPPQTSQPTLSVPPVVHTPAQSPTPSGTPTPSTPSTTPTSTPVLPPVLGLPTPSRHATD